MYIPVIIFLGRLLGCACIAGNLPVRFSFSFLLRAGCNLFARTCIHMQQASHGARFLPA
jgi:hypothetical protein